MYTPNDIEILDAYEDFVAEVGHLSDCSAAWLEAFKRGMRFNPDASQSIHAQDATRCEKCGESEPVLCCENCGHRWPHQGYDLCKNHLITDAPDTKICANCNKSYSQPVGKDVCPHCGY